MRIDLRNVRKRFGRTEALRGVSSEIPSGARVALVGPNGSGKSTLLRAVLGLVACEGDVLLDGLPIFQQRSRLARRIAYVPQVAPRIAASVRELVSASAAVRDIDPERIYDLAARLDLDARDIQRKPFQDLSGGMKQKLLVALGLAAQVDLLVLDEPTASLDAPSRQRFFSLAAEVPEKTTIVLCSHRIEEIRGLARGVLALREGEVAYDGPLDGYLNDGAHAVVELRLTPVGRKEHGHG